MNKILSLSVVALSLALSQAPLAYACHEHAAHGKHMEEFADKLNLDTKQREQLKSIKADAKQKITPYREQLHAIRDKINAAFQAGDVSASQQTDFVNQEKDVIGSMLTVRMQERADIQHILTDEQRAKLTSIIKQCKEKHHDNDD